MLFCVTVNNFKFTAGTAPPFIPQTPAARRLLQSDAKLQGDSTGCLQPSHITLIDAAWLHRRLSTQSVCLAVESSWPSIDSSYTGCHLVDQSPPLHRPSCCRKLNATPPLGSRRTQHVKIPYGWWGGGNLIIPPMLRINLPAKHYSNQKHNLLNVCIHQPCHLC